jgi:hypothetical protein
MGARFLSSHSKRIGSRKQLISIVEPASPLLGELPTDCL